MLDNQSIIIKLYVSCIGPDDQESILEIKNFLQSKFGEHFKLELIDIFESPGLAEAGRVIATPLAVRELPSPVQRIILDFNDKKKLLLGMELIVNKN